MKTPYQIRCRGVGKHLNVLRYDAYVPLVMHVSPLVPELIPGFNTDSKN